MSVETPPRAGLAAVSRLDDLPPLERRLVVYARLWAAGRGGQAEVRRDLVARHGLAIGRAAHDRLDELMCLVLVHARRPQRVGPVDSDAAVADECVLARLVALATDGAREEAILMSALVIRADLALELARVAAALGRLMLRRPGAVAPMRV
jgi:hypothetical protein